MKRLLALPLTLVLISTLGACGHSHQFGDWQITAAATCTEDGQQERTCECGEVDTEVIPATGHNFGDAQVITAASCTEDGEQTRTCIECGYTETEVIQATGHKFKAATYFSPKKCSLCGYTEGEALATLLESDGSASGDKYEFSISDIYYTTEISEKVGDLTAYYGDDGYYLVIKLSFTNLDTGALDKYNTNRVSNIQLSYDEKYSYDGKFVVLTDDIVPLATANAYVMFSVPESMGTDPTKSIYATFTVDKDSYVICLQEGTESEDEPLGDNSIQAELTSDIFVGDSRTDGENFSFDFTGLYYSTRLSEKVGNTTFSYGGDGYYLIIKLSFTNLGTEALDQYHTNRVSDIQLSYDGKYNYDGMFVVLTDNIVPLATANAYVAFSVPEMVASGEEPLIASFTVFGNTFYVDCRANY
jgi:hypothetical protein